MTHKPRHPARIDLGLALLRRRCRPNVPQDLADIAAWCGCSYQNICLIEQKALRKIRRRLTAEDRKQLAEVLAARDREVALPKLPRGRMLL